MMSHSSNPFMSASDAKFQYDKKLTKNYLAAINKMKHYPQFGHFYKFQRNKIKFQSYSKLDHFAIMVYK